MPQNTAKNTVTDIIQDVRIPVTATTVQWLESLYMTGAIMYLPNGQVQPNAKVREAISAMHHVLGGGDVDIVIRREGDAITDKLENQFDTAMAEASTAHQHRDGKIKEVSYIP